MNLHFRSPRGIVFRKGKYWSCCNRDPIVEYCWTIHPHCHLDFYVVTIAVSFTTIKLSLVTISSIHHSWIFISWIMSPHSALLSSCESNVQTRRSQNVPFAATSDCRRSSAESAGLNFSNQKPATMNIYEQRRY